MIFNDYLDKAEKPIAIIGNGARNAKLNIEMPFLCTWGTKDMLYNHPFCKGDFGITGQNGNKLLKEADLILIIGARMDTHQVPDWDKFAPQAKKVAVGLEFPHEVDHKHEVDLDGRQIYLKADDWGTKEENTTDKPIYRWVDKICGESLEDDIIIPDMGQTGCIVFQRWKPKGRQRIFNGMNHSPMGYSLPASIGASLATGRRVIVIIGDGSLMMNLQDLQTISDLKLPVKIYVVNNGGYGMIRQTQNDWKEYLAQGIAANFQIPNINKLKEIFNIDIEEVKFEDTTISPKWKWGEEL